MENNLEKIEKNIFTEIGFGNESFLSTEVEEGDSEYRVKGFILPEKIKGVYLRFYIGKKNIILSSKNGLVIKKKEKPKFKILFGIYGISQNFKRKK
jgi:prolyl-tRNA synthetase